MIGRIVEVSEPNRYLSLEYGNMLVKRDREIIARLALDDIQAIIVSSRGSSQSSALLAELAERNIPFIVSGKNYAPVGILTPLEGNFHQSARIDAQVNASKPLQKRLWQQIVRAKLSMQSIALQVINQPSRTIDTLIPRVKSGDPENIEGQGARYYWKQFFGSAFRRDRDSPGINALLNYGYAVLRSSAARAVVAAGLHPGIGIHHKNGYNPMRLVDDLLEPYRPLVDLKVLGLVNAGLLDMTTQVKRELISVINTDVPTHLGTSPVSVSLQYLAGSLSSCLMEGSTNLLLPPHSIQQNIAHLARVHDE